ncbi:hypothetical protein EST38_g6423 [Candolleomyces aberdarensis]|uniref:Nephrocystin 3-like N-terminal domain-containing protein n=1 Tax=Candolleomyces aberdarensis TaxID=2316362 RepID=A0A4Q2DL11_9AGAR|nr:hypothetical protein EST38_g6423 [Candolleomyces aberdarensis]
MAEPPLHIEIFSGARGVQLGQQTINVIAGNQYFFNGGGDLVARLNPIPDASHTRDRKTSPPDSACFPGTREGVITEITTWANAVDSEPGTEDREIGTTVSALVVYTPTPHIYWLHGFAGCGKSAVSLKIADIFEESGRLLASYFFFRNAGDRSTMRRFAVTLANQLASALPATMPFIETALRADPGLLNSCVSLTRQLERLVYRPFQAVMAGDILEEALTKGPFIIVIDGLDECEDRQGVEEFIDQMLDFFETHPDIPLRIFIASRVEQHIRERLETDGVRLADLNRHSPHKDIEKFLQVSFQKVAKRDRVIRTYVQARGAWPTRSDMNKLISHINGSFVLASSMFKYIVQPATAEDPLSPMERLPLTLNMNGLDGLYTRTLALSQHIPHFRNVISTIALLKQPLPIVDIADLLGIEAFEVVRVLLNLQAIIHVPGTDDEADVTLCHTSLRDFLTTENRSGSFFVPRSYHLHLSYYCLSSTIERPSALAYDYGRDHLEAHWQSFADSEASDFINEIEQFKAHQPLLVNRLAYHAFLCSMLFCTLLTKSRPLNDNLYLITECTKQLALAAECHDHRIQVWLEKGLHYGFLSHVSHTLRFTEHTYEAQQHDLRRASAAIYAKFPEILERYPTSSGMEIEIDHLSSWWSGIDIFNVLKWIVTRARFSFEFEEVSPADSDVTCDADSASSSPDYNLLYTQYVSSAYVVCKRR